MNDIKAKAEKVAAHISYMLNDKNVTISVSTLNGSVIVDSEIESSYTTAVAKLQEKMGLVLKTECHDELCFMGKLVAA